MKNIALILRAISDIQHILGSSGVISEWFEIVTLVI